MYINQKNFIYNVKDLSVLLLKDANQRFSEKNIDKFYNIKNDSNNLE